MAALNVDWNAIRLAAVAGVSFKELARQHGMPNTDTIRQRSCREKWPIPESIIRRARVAAAKAAEEQEAAKKQLVERKLPYAPPPPPVPVQAKEGPRRAIDSCIQAGDTIATVLAALAERSGIRASELAADALDRAPDLDIKSLTDVMTALKVTRLVAGIDKEQPQVAILWGGNEAPAFREVSGNAG